MSYGKPISGLAEKGGGQFSKFSIIHDRPTKRRKNTKKSDAGLSSSATASGSSAATKQTKEAVGKDKDDAFSAPTRSCAECRRMKLKCDRVFPCQTCVRRGLEGICPEGSLATGRGTRYVLASTKELHEKILRMADRIKGLEDALATLHQEHASCRPCSCQLNLKHDQPVLPHPLLRSELLLIKSQLELYALDPLKKQAKSERDSPEEHPSSSESAPPLEDIPRMTTIPSASLRQKGPDSEIDADDKTLNVPEVKRKLSSTEDADEGERLTDGKRQRHDEECPEERGRRLRAMLPPREEAEHLTREVMNGAWILNIAARPAKRAKLLYTLYDGPLRDMRAQDVALALATFAIGTRVEVDIGSGSSGSTDASSSGNVVYSYHNDTWRPSGNLQQSMSGPNRGTNTDESEKVDKKELERSGRCRSRAAQESFYLAKVALSEVSVRGEPDITVVHCLYLMTWYLAVLADIKGAGREATVLMSLAVRIAFKIGLHLEETYEGLSAEEQQERRILFWAVLHIESRLLLGTDRRGALGTMRITAKRPLASIPGTIKSFPTHAEAVYHDFKLAFLEECIVPTLETIARAPKLRLQEHDYYDVLALDRLIRDFEIPSAIAQPAGAPPTVGSCESLPATSSANTISILNLSTNVSASDLNYGGCKAPHNVLAMIHAKAQQEKLVTLLHLHRAFFYAHIRDHGPLVQRRFLPSAIASFSAACALIRNVKDVYAAEPEMATRVSVLWYNAFCAATSLFMLVVYKPFCPVSVLALQEVEKARDLFLTASPKCHMAARSYPILREFHAKASDVFNRWHEESEGDMDVFGPNGEVIVCQTRIDIVIQRLQYVSVSSADEEDATTGLLSLKTRCAKSLSAVPEKSAGKLPLTPRFGIDALEHSDELFYDMWHHVHKELTDVVRRIPEVLRDAVVDPRRATAARLIWGFIPPLEESKSKDLDGSALVEKVQMEAGLPSDLDWNVFADALMHMPAAHAGGLGVPPVHLGLPSPPVTTYSPEGSLSSFSMLDMCTDFESGAVAASFKQGDSSGYTAKVNMDSTTMFGQDGGLSELFENYGDAPHELLPDESALGYVHGGSEYGNEVWNGNQYSAGQRPGTMLASSGGESENGTLGYLWQHRLINSPYLSSTSSSSSVPSSHHEFIAVCIDRVPDLA